MNAPLAWTEYCKSLSPAIVEICTSTPVAAGPGALLKGLATALPEWPFRHAFCRGGWYRLGGIVDAGGVRIASDLERWVEEEVERVGGDIGQLIDDHAAQALYATRLVGKTHYLVAPVGEAHDDFLQLEIEELQEIRAHRLFANDPASVEEIVDPRGGTEGALPIGLPCYRLRRIHHVGAFLMRMRAQSGEKAPIHRMLEDWTRSSAGTTSAFSNHWVIATREHLDRYQQPIFRAQPIATLTGAPPAFSAGAETRGLKLQEALNRFDRDCGYPLAWYFHMLSTKAVPHWVAQAVVEDALGGFAYLPQKDVDVVRDWLHRPYAA